MNYPNIHGFSHRNETDQIKKLFYARWQNMKTRCLNKNRKDWPNYGGRGIKICNSWINFPNFKQDMYDTFVEHYINHGAKNTTLDRIDVNKGYYKNNCRWATKQEQGKRRDSIYYSYRDNLYTIKELVIILGWPYITIYQRIKKGISLEKPRYFRINP